MLGKIECGKKQEQQDQMVGWHHQFNGYEFEQTLGDSNGQEAWHTAVHEVAKSWTQSK